MKKINLLALLGATAFQRVSWDKEAPSKQEESLKNNSK